MKYSHLVRFYYDSFLRLWGRVKYLMPIFLFYTKYSYLNMWAYQSNLVTFGFQTSQNKDRTMFCFVLTSPLKYDPLRCSVKYRPTKARRKICLTSLTWENHSQVICLRSHKVLIKKEGVNGTVELCALKHVPLWDMRLRKKYEWWTVFSLPHGHIAGFHQLDHFLHLIHVPS